MAYVTTMKQGDMVRAGSFTFKMCRVVGRNKAMIRIEAPDEERIEKINEDPIPCSTED